MFGHKSELCSATTLSEMARVHRYLGLRASLGPELSLTGATKEQYERMIAEGLGELDKSGIAELTFKDRHKSRDGGSDQV